MSKLNEDGIAACHHGEPSGTVSLRPSAVDDDPLFQRLLTELVAEGSAHAVLQPVASCPSLPAVLPLLTANNAQLSDVVGGQLLQQRSRQSRISEQEHSAAHEAKQQTPALPRRKPGRPAKDPGTKTAAWVLKNRRAQQRFRDKQKVWT